MLCLKSNTEQQKKRAIDRVCYAAENMFVCEIADQNNATSRSVQFVIHCTGGRIYEKIESVVGKLMSGKGGNADSLQPEHSNTKVLLSFFGSRVSSIQFLTLKIFHSA